MSQQRQFDESRFLPLNVRASGQEGIVEGLAAPFDVYTPVEGKYMERLTRETFQHTVTKGEGAKAPLLMHHDSKKEPVGKVLEWDIRDNGLYGKWQLDMESERAREAWRLADREYLTGLSIGFQPIEGNDKVEFDDYDIPHVTRGAVKLREVSMVSVAAYAEASVTLTRSAGIQTVRDPRIAAIKKEWGFGE